MRVRALFAILLALAFVCAASAQDTNSAPPTPPDNGMGRYPQRGGRGGFGGMGMADGRGLIGTVTEVAADHYTIKTEEGETYTVHFSANTRIMKQPAGAMRRGGREGSGGGMGRGGNPPEPIKATDIKVGDAIGAMGQLDQSAKSIGAVAIIQLDPERAKQMAEMRANYGKTWIQGKVTAIDGVKVTVMGSIDNVAHSFVANESTIFRKRREPITLADIQVGDMVRAEGALKDGAFTATAVNVMGMPPGGAPRGPRNQPPQ